jgi:hypothetical protein
MPRVRPGTLLASYTMQLSQGMRNAMRKMKEMSGERGWLLLAHRLLGRYAQGWLDMPDPFVYTTKYRK